MIIVDTALQRREQEDRPIRVDLVGAGFMARGVAPQITTAVPGMRVGKMDRLGGYMRYGPAENLPTARAQNLLPIGLAEGCRLKRAISKATLLTFADVELPPNRLCDRLWREQLDRFFPDYSKPRNEATP